MPRVSIDYLNARRQTKPASGGRVYRLDSNAVDLRAQWQAADPCEQVLLELDHAIADFRAKIASVRDESEMMLNGESYDDLSF